MSLRLKQTIHQLVILFILVIGMTHSLQSQVIITPYVGTTYSKMRNTEDVKNCTYFKYENKYQFRRYNYGIDISKTLNKSFVIGIDFNVRNGRAKGFEPYVCASDSGFNWVDYDYIYFQPNIKYFYKSLFLNAGISYGLNLNSEYAYTTFFGRIVEDAEAIVNRKNIGLHGGLGVRIKHVNLALEYLHSVNEVILEDKLLWLQVKLGYEFVIGKGKR